MTDVPTGSPHPDERPDESEQPQQPEQQPPPSSPPPAGGAPPAGTPPQAGNPPQAQWPQQPRGMTPSEQRNWATGAHLSALVLAFFGGLAVLGPLVVYLIKKDEDTFVAEHAKEALNFQLTWLIGGVVATILGIIVALVTVGIGLIVLIPAAIGLFIAWIVFTIKAAMVASRGEYYRYPMSVRMVN